MKFSAFVPLLSFVGLSFAGTGAASAASVDAVPEPDTGSSVSAPLNFAGPEDFDLARRGSARPLVTSGVASESLAHHFDPSIDPAGIEASGFDSRDTLGPSWSYRQSEGAPEIAFAALGAGKKGRPGLVHLALDWNF